MIDTSGSMQADNWENAQNVMKEILDIYPKVKGMQILDDEGKPMFSSTKGQWLQDTPAQRAKILSTMVNWKPYSNSSPGGRNRRRGAGMVGRGQEDQCVCHRRRLHRQPRSKRRLQAVRKYNPVDRQGRHKIRIHAIGMPDGREFPAVY